MNQTQKASVNICDTFKVITAHGIGKAKVVDDMIDDKLCYKLVDYLRFVDLPQQLDSFVCTHTASAPATTRSEKLCSIPL